jgi:hypothetical protein
MKDFLIKTPKNKYCLLHASYTFNQYYFIKYLEDNPHLIKKSNQEAFFKNLEIIKSYSDAYGHINVLNYREHKNKPLVNTNNIYTLNEVAQNYQLLKKLNQYFKPIEKELKRNTLLFKNLTAKEFKNYFNYSECELFIYDKISKENEDRSFIKNFDQYTDEKKERFCKKLLNLSSKKLESIKISDKLIRDKIRYDHYLSNPFIYLLKKWEKLLDDKGNVKHLENNSPIARFKESIRYAIFVQKKSSEEKGYFKSHKNYFVDISDAKLYKKIPDAINLINQDRYIVSIVEVKTKFNKINNTLNEDYLHKESIENALYQLQINEEKEHLESNLKSFIDNDNINKEHDNYNKNNKPISMNSISATHEAQHLLRLCHNEEIKKYLKDYINHINPNIKKKNKI